MRALARTIWRFLSHIGTVTGTIGTAGVLIAWLRGAPIEVVLILLVSVIGAVAAAYLAVALWRRQRAERMAQRVAPLLALRKDILDLRDRCRGTPEDTRSEWGDAKTLSTAADQAAKVAGTPAEDIALLEMREPIPKKMVGRTPDHGRLLDFLSEKARRLFVVSCRLQGKTEPERERRDHDAAP
jgi:hypothetical protein